MTPSSAQCDALLKGFRPEFGNESHIYLLKQVRLLTIKRKEKRLNLKEIERLEKSIIYTLQKK